MKTKLNEDNQTMINHESVSIINEIETNRSFNIDKTDKSTKKRNIFFIDKKISRSMKTKKNQLLLRKQKINNYLRDIKSIIDYTFLNRNALDLSYIKVFTQLMLEQNHSIDFYSCSLFEDIEYNKKDQIIKDNEDKKDNNSYNSNSNSNINRNQIATTLFKMNNCNCQKNSCKKKYCECKRNKEPCNIKCNCLNCINDKRK